MTTREYDIVVLGGSGFTGKHAVEEIAKLLHEKKVEQFTWAVAGRSKSKLSKVLEAVSKFTGYDVTTVKILEVDVEDQDSLHRMARQAKVVLNCVGPYIFFGEQVVKACIAEGTHHLDISGEPQFLEKMQLVYHDDAEEKGVYVIGACGFDSIPSDMGITYLKEKFKGELNSVETYMEFGKGAMKSTTNLGTFASALEIIANIKELRPIRSKLFSYPLPEPKYPIKNRSIVHYNEIVKGWVTPFLGTDKAVLERTERYLFQKEHKRPVQVNTYSKQDGFFQAIFLMIGIILIGVMAQFKFLRNILIKHPRFFTLGYFSNVGPTREQADFDFTLTIVGSGWSEALAEPSTDQHQDPPNKTMTVKLRGRNPAYGCTVVCLIQAALTVLREADKMPSKGGVYTTAAAFSKTTIIPRLHSSGLTFEVVKDH